jgi:hypothetical protein
MPAAGELLKQVGKRLIKPSTGKVIAQTVEEAAKGFPKPEGFLKDPAGALWRSIAPNKFLATSRKLMTDPVGAMQAGWKSPKLTKGQIALMSAFSAPDVMAIAKNTHEPGQPGRAERLGSLAGSWAGMTAYSRLPLLGNMLGWTAGEYLGSKAGKLGGKLYGMAKTPSMAQKMEAPSVSSRSLMKAGADKHEKLRRFAKKQIRFRNREITDNARVLGDIQTVTFRDPTGVFERQVATENRPHA